MGYTLIIVILITVNFLTVVFYQRQVQALIDKSMSKTYAEYVQTKKLEQGSPLPAASTQDDVTDDSVLEELNAIFKS